MAVATGKARARRELPAEDAGPPQPVGQTLRFMQLLWQLAHGLQVRSKRMAKELGVTGPQRLALRVLGQTPGIGAGELAATLGLHPSTLTGVLARLEEQGLVARVAHPTDRRRTRLRLTPAGQRIDRERRGTVEAAVKRALAKAGGERIAAASELLALISSELARPE